MKLPKLYKKTSTGAIQFWEIEATSNQIITTYGQLDTASPQQTTDLISSGKNIGRSNETTIEHQTELEAKAKWEKQLKKGYAQTLDDATSGKVDQIIEGGVPPMLAHKFSEQGHKIQYPAYTQPKLDGIRCVAIINNGKCTLWTRTRKLITSVPHIEKELEKMFSEEDIILDGELYNHSFKTNFEKIVSIVRQEIPMEGHQVVQYHIYDLVDNNLTFDQRYKKLLENTYNRTIVLVETQLVSNEPELIDMFDLFKNLGYEGSMVRNKDGKYVNKRSYDLQKIKDFIDGEFQIVGVEEGRGKLQGHVASFVCQMDDGKQFKAKMKGDTERLKDYFNDHSLWLNKKLTVKYQGLTGKNGVPRFPVGIVIRDYE